MDAPVIDRYQNITTSGQTACSITRSGKVILLSTLLSQSNNTLQIIDDITSQSSWSLNNNITYLGSQKAIDTLIRNRTLSNFASTTFDDFLIIFGGEESGSNVKAQSTFILDTRYDTEYVWYDLPITQTKTPPPTSSSSLYATSRWILHFRSSDSIILNNNTTIFTIYVDLFDPYSFQWIGTLTSFNTTGNFIQAVPIASGEENSAIQSTDSLLLIPTWSSSPIHQPNTAIGIDFWRLDISNWDPTNYNVTQQSSPPNEITVTSAFINREEPNSNNNDNNIVTPIAADMALFYGGEQQLQFLNTTSRTFSPNPQWLLATDNTTISNTAEVKTLPIILGTVIGGLLFLVLLILFIWCYGCRRRKRRDSRILRLNNNNNHDEKLSRKHTKVWLLSLFTTRQKSRDRLYNKKSGATPAANEDVSDNENNNRIRSVSLVSQYTLPSVKCLSPVQLTPTPSDGQDATLSALAETGATAASSASPQKIADEGIVQQPKFKSRFKEHFDYSSFPLVRYHHDKQHVVISRSLPLVADNAFPSEHVNREAPAKEASQNQKIFRSVSSYV